jgi:transcription initiation factor TFIIE subunit alpha
MKGKGTLKIKGVREFLLDFIGEEGIGIIELLAEKGIVDEFKIAELLEKEVNNVRSLLYKLYSKKIVSYTKERDEEKGWWIYSWELHLRKILNLFKAKKKEVLKGVEEKIQAKKGAHLYECPVCLIVFPFSEATENMFQCPSCGGPLNHKPNLEEVKDLETHRSELKKDIKDLDEIKVS